MKSRLIAMVVLATLVPAGNATAEYDFFNRAVFPGNGRKPDVDIYKVEEVGDPGNGGYERRVVQWWPRKGMDTVEVKPEMPLRTWTLREKELNPKAIGEDIIFAIETLNQRTPWGRPRQFKAHLVSFRGLGNRQGNPFEPGDYYCPAAVLRLEDGTLRCFTRGMLIEEDEKFLLDLYSKEIDRVRESQNQENVPLGDGTKKAWPNNEPGQPGTMRVESKHFVWLSGSQHAPNEKYSPWVNRDYPEKARLFREGSISFAEDMWTYQKHGGIVVYDGKHSILVAGTYKNGNTWIGGFAGGGRGGCILKFAGGGPWSMALAHEYGHGMLHQTRYGGGEQLADACAVICDPSEPKHYGNAKRPWLNCLHGRYGTGMFYAIMGQDPNWGYVLAAVLPPTKDESSVFHTIARMGQERGLYANGVRGIGDMVGEFAARQAEFDCELQETMRRHYISVKRNYLEAVDRKAGLYRIPPDGAPQAFGANIIRLVPEDEADKITVDLRGYHDPDTHGDWRACIVVAGGDGRVRYSPMWSKGPMEMEVKEDDRRFWLTVAATPSALPLNVQEMLAHTYPYEVKLSGCRPGTPHNMPGDSEDYGLTYLAGWRDRFGGGVCVIPHPDNSPEAKILSETLPPLRAKVDELKQETARILKETNKIDVDHYRYLRRFRPFLMFLDDYVDWMQDGIKGHRHPNGGGWVSDSAEVAPTAYVGPDAMVLYGAKVLDNAAIEDYAVVKGPDTVISGHAKLSGQAYVSGNAQIGGYTRVIYPIITDDEPVEPNEVQLRGGQEKGDGEKLWASYAMNLAENQVLKDYFQMGGPNLNGHLYGRPQFVDDGQRRGFAFDGKTQYAEASPMLADLGQMTVEIALEWQGQGRQTIFDFGSSLDDRMVLETTQDGKPQLVATVGGETALALTSHKPLPKNDWATLRIEIDGTKATILLDDAKVAQQQSKFRPADAYRPGVEKRNFLAASRDATAHFKGTIDRVRVFHAVFDDFAASCRKEASDFEAAAKLRDEAIKAKVDPIMAFYAGIGPVKNKRVGEINSAVAEDRKLAEEKGSKHTNRFKPEADWLECSQWLFFSHHYNYNYRAYVAKRAGRQVGNKKKFHQNPDELETRHREKSKEKWYTQPDWE